MAKAQNPMAILREMETVRRAQIKDSVKKDLLLQLEVALEQAMAEASGNNASAAIASTRGVGATEVAKTALKA